MIKIFFKNFITDGRFFIIIKIDREKHAIGTVYNIGLLSIIKIIKIKNPVFFFIIKMFESPFNLSNIFLPVLIKILNYDCGCIVVVVVDVDVDNK